MALEKFQINGKTALITGACGLLGIEHAAALLECGAKVVLTDLKQTDLNRSSALLAQKYDRNNIINRVMDVTDQKSIYSIAEQLETEAIDISILINNAAIDPKVFGEKSMKDNSRLETFTLEQWDQELSVGLTGAFLCSKTFGTKMAKTGRGGIILNIASDLSVISPDQRLYRKEGLPNDLQPVKPVTYSVIKSGLIGLTRYLATYWADKGIRCNALSPGGVLNGQSMDFIERLSNLIPIARMAYRDEYRAAIQFLCSDASSYMNGQNIVMDGGRSIW